MSEWLSYRMREEFLDNYRGRDPKFGFGMGAGNSLGHHTWITKYARRKQDGTRERFWEGLRRVIEGMYSAQKDHALRYRLPWDEGMAHRSAEEAYERCFLGKWSPPGRGFWAMGSEAVSGKGDSSALQNCAMISTEDIGTMDDPALPFSRAMDMLMMGVGVGFDVLGAGKIALHDPTGRYPHAIGDSREGWCESLASLLRAFLTGSRLPVFDYSRIRPAGAVIHGFGGVAAGPDPLRRLHEQLTSILSGREGQMLSSTDITDIMNLTGKCVVAGNVRRSAEIALGLPDDEKFLALKDWEANPVRTGRDGWSHLSNNSILAEVGGDYSHITRRIALNGEPGLVWLDVCRQYGRLVDPPDNRDYRVRGVNPCAEQPLEHMELCTLAETYPTNHESLRDYLRTLKFAFLYSKSVTLLMTQWPETNEVMIRNRRIGVGMSGVAMFAEDQGWAELRRWQDLGYREIRKWDQVYSAWLGVRESIKVTTVKPSGTVSLLFGVTPGVHFPRERGFYVRTVRDMKDSLFAKAMQEAGYPVEPSVSDPDTTVVISLPVEGPDIRGEKEVSIWEKASLAVLSQRHWSDNAVSCTVTFSEDEGKEIPAVLRAFDGQLKSISFLPMAEGTYQQAPYQRVGRETWDAMRANLKPVDWNALYGSPGLPEPEGENFCSNDACELPQRGHPNAVEVIDQRMRGT